MRLALTLCFLVTISLAGCSNSRPATESQRHDPDRAEIRKGEMSKKGGTATKRKDVEPLPDDPDTTNDESNDQPVGHFGTKTLFVNNTSSGNSYYLDADLEGLTVERLYFPKGGWVDFYDCELDDSYSGLCTDENGNMWDIQGE